MISRETYKAYEQAMLYFLTQDPFHGHVLANMQLHEVDDRVPTAIMPVAGVSIVGTQLHLYLRKGEFAALPPKQRVFVMRHEVLHIVNLHLNRMGNRNMPAWNEATDLAINSLIERVPGSEMPDWVLHPRTYTPRIGINLPERESAEVYYDLLQRNCRAARAFLDPSGKIVVGRANGQGGAQATTPEGSDLHPFWRDTMAQSPSLTDAAVRRVVSEAYQRYGSRLAGMYPAEYVRGIKELLEPEIDWRRYTALFVGSILSGERKRTWMRPNRRENPYLRGQKRTLSARVVCGLDTSGSISDDELTRFVSELRGVLRCYSTELYAIPCDAVAYDPVLVQSTTDLSRLVRQLKGGGGTMFMPVIEAAKALRADGIIYFTDGENFDGLPEEEPIRTLWVLTPDGRVPARWGQVTRFQERAKRSA